MKGVQRHLARFRLAGLPPLRRRLQPVIHRVAHQVHQRIGQALHHGFVDLGVRPLNRQLYGFAQLPRHLTHHARETAEHLIHRHHAQGQRVVAYAFHQRVDDGHRLQQLGVATVLRNQLGACGRNHQLAHPVDQPVQLAGLHPNIVTVAAGRPARRRARLAARLALRPRQPGRLAHPLRLRRRQGPSRHPARQLRLYRIAQALRQRAERRQRRVRRQNAQQAALGHKLESIANLLKAGLGLQAQLQADETIRRLQLREGRQRRPDQLHLAQRAQLAEKAQTGQRIKAVSEQIGIKTQRQLP